MAFPVSALPEACEEEITHFCNDVFLLRDVGRKSSDKKHYEKIEIYFPLSERETL